MFCCFVFFFNDTATTEIYTLSLHDALPIFVYAQMKNLRRKLAEAGADTEIRAVYGFGYKLVQP